jgi:nitrate reductase gamma subunit
MSTFAFVIWPYIALSVFIVGHIWRWRSDKFGWGTHTSQVLERRWLQAGSPLFHTGVLLVVLGHALGLLIPASVTEAVGLSEHNYHLMAVTGGVIAGTLMCAGLIVLIVRRIKFRDRLRWIHTGWDWVLYPVLVLAVGLGMGATLYYNVFGDGYNYRETLAVWFRSIFYLNPQAELMVDVPLAYQVHAVCGFLLFAIWPFTRLVHVWSAPLEYLVRPFVVYRSRRYPAGSLANAGR